ncbi:MAG TPA: ice-binding family protein [Dehalococcoidia bacterium]|nr:ice-binding family protein [Dehalococcoidia bacterium]
MFQKSITTRLAVAFGVVALAIVLLTLGSATNSDAATAPGLGGAGTYGVLGSSTVTNTGFSVIDGDVGVSPGSEVTGFPPGIANGTIHEGDQHAADARADATTAYNALSDATAEPCTLDLTGEDLGGLTLTEGVYCFDTSAQLTGTLTLDAQGNPAAVFIFRIGSTLTTATNSSVVMINEGVDCNAFWRVGSSATLGVGTSFKGNILALTSITLNTNAVLSGRALALNGAVTLDDNDVGFAACAAATETPAPSATDSPTDAPTDTAAPTSTPDAPTGTTVPTTPPGTTPTPPGTTPTPPGTTPTSPGTTPTPPVTATPTPTETPNIPTGTPTPSPFITSSPSPTATPPTETQMAPPPAPTKTPEMTTITRFPNTGGAPPTTPGLPVSLLFLGLVLSAVGATTFALSRRYKEQAAAH